VPTISSNLEWIEASPSGDSSISTSIVPIASEAEAKVITFPLLSAEAVSRCVFSVRVSDSSNLS
jgi:hypothetical protein